MDEAQLRFLQSENSGDIKSVLEEFNSKHADLFNFDKFDKNDQWLLVWKNVFKILNNLELVPLHKLCLNTVRILTRNKLSLQTHDIVDEVNCLIRLSGLANDCITTSMDIDIIAEALKCLCNLAYQNVECRRLCLRNYVADALVRRVGYSSSFELFDLKLLFLLIAFESEAHNRVKFYLNGLVYLTAWLEEKLNESTYNDQQLEILSEILKVMFTITSSPDKNLNENENEIQNRRLTDVIRNLLLRFSDFKDRERFVISQSVNLLTNISSNCLTELTVKCETNSGDTSQQLTFDGRNVRALDILLRYLRIVLDEHENSASSNEVIPPILTVLVKCAHGNSTMRRYIRSVILPPLKDVSQRPEVGVDLRNHLCRFLTLPTMIVRDLAAELLFVCCKENVGRMIKYTGYGNAAGLFANRGLLDCRRVDNAQYSSDSEDSDTEEYKKLQEDINPVLGCFESAKRNPLEGMSEEQKEYEAVQLANLMDKLHRSGIVQPCRIGEDGKPQPLEHILQLQEELPQQQLDQKRKT